MIFTTSRNVTYILVWWPSFQNDFPFHYHIHRNNLLQTSSIEGIQAGSAIKVRYKTLNWNKPKREEICKAFLKVGRCVAGDEHSRSLQEKMWTDLVAFNSPFSSLSQHLSTKQFNNIFSRTCTLNSRFWFSAALLFFDSAPELNSSSYRFERSWRPYHEKESPCIWSVQPPAS